MDNKNFDIINLKEAIRNNQPILIKNFLLNYQKDLTDIISDINNTENVEKHFYSSGVYVKNLDSHNFISKIKSDLNNENKLFYSEKNTKKRGFLP